MNRMNLFGNYRDAVLFSVCFASTSAPNNSTLTFIEMYFKCKRKLFNIYIYFFKCKCLNRQCGCTITIRGAVVSIQEQNCDLTGTFCVKVSTAFK